MADGGLKHHSWEYMRRKSPRYDIICDLWCFQWFICKGGILKHGIGYLKGEAALWIGGGGIFWGAIISGQEKGWICLMQGIQIGSCS